ncbi:hypothetical protein [Lacipirellula limnantheis]|uniref:hypothetical protein n=1 Tax=Lacipirellula limnantheis TaxID=2528024 RepID=UPI0011A9B314|nr:hypothetical protein [Lacipirellula limnantheis]
MLVGLQYRSTGQLVATVRQGSRGNSGERQRFASFDGADSMASGEAAPPEASKVVRRFARFDCREQH